MAISRGHDEIVLAGDKYKVYRQPTRQGQEAAPQWSEREVVGPEIPQKSDAELFRDNFNSWHQGAMYADHVHNGFYGRAVNVDCTVPGRIRPSPARRGTVNVPLNVNRDHYGITGMKLHSGRLYLFGRQEAGSGDNRPNTVYCRIMNPVDRSLSAANHVLSTTASDYIGRNRFTNSPRPLVHFNQNGIAHVYYPYGNGYRGVNDGGITGSVVIGCQDLYEVAGRVYKASLDNAGRLLLDNIDTDADMTAAASWSGANATKLRIGEQLSILKNVSLQIASLAALPYVAAALGSVRVVEGGDSWNHIPEMELNTPGLHAVRISRVSRSLALATTGAGQIIWYSTTLPPTQIGPNSRPLARPETSHPMEMFEGANGDLWVLYHYPGRTNAEGVWELLRGIKTSGSNPGPGSYAWHPVWTDVPGHEGGPDNNGGADDGRYRLLRPFLPIEYLDSAGDTRREIVVATGHDYGRARVTFLAGEMFYGLQDTDPSWRFEDGSGGYTVPVRWESGRISRASKGTYRHYTAVHLVGENLGGPRVAGGEVQVFYRLDGSAAWHAAGAMSGNARTLPLDIRGHDIELRFVWSLNGESGTGAASMGRKPATITNIIVEGREIPIPANQIRAIIDPRARLQGQAHRNRNPSDVYDRLQSMSRAGKQPLTDIFGKRRIVTVSPPTAVSAAEAQELQLPEGLLSLQMMQSDGVVGHPGDITGVYGRNGINGGGDQGDVYLGLDNPFTPEDRSDIQEALDGVDALEDAIADARRTVGVMQWDVSPSQLQGRAAADFERTFRLQLEPIRFDFTDLYFEIYVEGVPVHDRQQWVSSQHLDVAIDSQEATAIAAGLSGTQDHVDFHLYFHETSTSVPVVAATFRRVLIVEGGGGPGGGTVDAMARAEAREAQNTANAANTKATANASALNRIDYSALLAVWPPNVEQHSDFQRTFQSTLAALDPSLATDGGSTGTRFANVFRIFTRLADGTVVQLHTQGWAFTEDDRQTIPWEVSAAEFNAVGATSATNGVEVWGEFRAVYGGGVDELRGRTNPVFIDFGEADEFPANREDLPSTATTDKAGLVEKATTAEMNAGTANKYPDAGTVKTYVDANSGGDGEGGITQQQRLGLLVLSPEPSSIQYSGSLATALAQTFRIKVSNPSILTGDIWVEGWVQSQRGLDRIKWSNLITELSLTLDATQAGAVAGAIGAAAKNLDLNLRFHSAAAGDHLVNRLRIDIPIIETPVPTPSGFFNPQLVYNGNVALAADNIFADGGFNWPTDSAWLMVSWNPAAVNRTALEQFLIIRNPLNPLPGVPVINSAVGENAWISDNRAIAVTYGGAQVTLLLGKTSAGRALVAAREARRDPTPLIIFKL